MNPLSTTAMRPKLVEEITHCLEAMPISLVRGRSDPEWTAEIKKGIGTIGLKHEYLVCASGFPEANTQEWLCDLVWFRNTPEGHLQEVALVLESEWNWLPDAIRYDFEKLLVAKAPIKVMVFQDYNGNLDELWSLLETSIRCYVSKDLDETYILAAFRETEHAFTIKTCHASELLPATVVTVSESRPPPV